MRVNKLQFKKKNLLLRISKQKFKRKFVSYFTRLIDWVISSWRNKNNTIIATWKRLKLKIFSLLSFKTDQLSIETPLTMGRFTVKKKS